MALSHYRDQKALYFSSETHCSILQHPLGGGGGVEGTTGHLAAGRGPREPTQKQKNFVCQPDLQKPQPLRRPRFANCGRAPLDARPALGRLTKRTRAALSAD
jgi:hypothetical protein